MTIWGFWFLILLILLGIAKITWHVAAWIGRWGSMHPLVIVIPLWLLEAALCWYFIKPILFE